ncbi:MAG: ATP-binding cassette domain-containing protein, partial [Kiloniellaceae bacterium]
MTGKPLITVRDLSVHFSIGGALLGQKNIVRAVNKVSLDIAAGTFFGLVGESGSGKTTLGRA